MMNLNSTQIGRLCKHLGRTIKVHNNNYKEMVGLIEKVHLTKLLMIQDLNLTAKFKGKDLITVDLKGNKACKEQQHASAPR